MQHLFSIALCCSALICFAQKQPNFIFILTDDQSYGMMACTGNEIVQTPNIDLLAEQGILFTNAHITSAICTPSRVSILLSQYERKHGVNFNSGTSVAPAAWEKSYPMLMRNAGYYTGWIGKNHAPVGEGGYQSGLMEKSFDYWYAGHDHLSFYPKDRHAIFKDAKSDTQLEILQEGINDFLEDSNESRMENAIRFLEERPDSQAFMLSICLNLPHGASTSTMQMKPSDDEIYKSLYRDQEIPLPTHYVAKKDIKTPKLPSHLLRAADRQVGYDYVDQAATLKERYIRQLQAMTGIDRMIAQLRSKLETLKLEANTIIIFTSDHGLFMGEFGLGGKALCYEKTTHVPLIIYDPTLDKSKRSGTNHALVQSIDLAPTMLAKAGIDIPKTFQGKDLNPLLNRQVDSVRRYLFTENLWSTHFGNPRCESIQDQSWKYIRYYENHNLSATKKIALAKQLGMKVNRLLYGFHDEDIVRYREYVEAPLAGEKVVYEELYHLAEDPDEVYNLVDNPRYQQTLERLRAAWAVAIKTARGSGAPQVLRYTVESRMENK